MPTDVAAPAKGMSGLSGAEEARLRMYPGERLSALFSDSRDDPVVIAEMHILRVADDPTRFPLVQAAMVEQHPSLAGVLGDARLEHTYEVEAENEEEIAEALERAQLPLSRSDVHEWADEARAAAVRLRAEASRLREAAARVASRHTSVASPLPRVFERPTGRAPRSRPRRTARSSRDGPPRESEDEPPLGPFPRRIPAARLVPLIQERLDAGCSIRELARLAGVPERRFRSLLAGDQTNVSWAVADAIVTRALGGPFLWIGDGPLADLYGVAAA